MALAFHARNPDYFVYRYEDLVAGNYRAVERYLGLQLTPGAAQVEAEHRRVARTCGKGNWRDWYTCEDVAFFRPRMARYLARYGYGDDWELNSRPTIEPQHASQYVLKLVQQSLTQDTENLMEKEGG
jgi:hypothetical protein